MHTSRILGRIPGAALLALFLGTLTAAADPAPAAAPAAMPSPAGALTEWPLLFIPNQGQWAPEVAYLARAAGADLAFGAREIQVSLHDEGQGTARFGLRLANARPETRLLPGALRETEVRYYVGQDPARWRDSLPTYDALRYAGIQEGIDLVFRGAGDERIAYDLEVAPGADPSRVRLELAGVKELTIEPTGVMILTLPNGRQVRQQAPVVYQEREGQRVPVSGRFVLLEADPERAVQVFGFQLGGYDSAVALVIDPTLNFSTIVGGSKTDEVKAMALTGSGATKALIVVGGTLSLPTDFVSKPLVHNATDTAVPAKKNALIYKLSGGSKLDFVVILGGNGDDLANAVTLTADAIYLTGQTTSTDFTNLNALYPLLPGGKTQAAFIAKIGKDGKLDSTASFSTYFGGTGVDAGKTIALDDDDNIYVGGETTSVDLVLVNPLDDNTPIDGDKEGFLIKLTPNASQLLLSTYFGGTDDDSIDFIAITEDQTRDIYLAGNTASADLFTKNALDSEGEDLGDSDFFVTRITSAGTQIAFSTYYGGSGADVLTDMAVDPNDRHLVLVGSTDSVDFPTENAIQSENASPDGLDAFVVKLDRFGTFAHFSTYFGGLEDDRALGVDVDTIGDIYVAGETASLQFPVENPLQNYYAGSKDGFLIKLNSYGFDLLVSSFFGGTGADSIQRVKSDPDDPVMAYIVGHTTAIATNTMMFPHPTTVQSPTFIGKPAGQSSFAAWLDEVTENRSIPVLSLGFVEYNPDQEAAAVTPEQCFTLNPLTNIYENTSTVSIKLTLTAPGAASTTGVSAFKTILELPEELQLCGTNPDDPTDTGIVWNAAFTSNDYQGSGLDPDDPIAPTDPEYDPRRVVLQVFQYQNSTPSDLPTSLATLKFIVKPQAIGTWNSPIKPGDTILKPAQFALALTQPTAADLGGRDLYIRATSGGVLTERRCNACLGDCDCSGGPVQIWEAQRAQITYGSGSGQPICSKSDPDPAVSMSPADLNQITANYLGNLNTAGTPSLCP